MAGSEPEWAEEVATVLLSLEKERAAAVLTARKRDWERLAREARRLLLVGVKEMPSELSEAFMHDGERVGRGKYGLGAQLVSPTELAELAPRLEGLPSRVRTFLHEVRTSGEALVLLGHGTPRSDVAFALLPSRPAPPSTTTPASERALPERLRRMMYEVEDATERQLVEEDGRFRLRLTVRTCTSDRFLSPDELEQLRAALADRGLIL